MGAVTVVVAGDIIGMIVGVEPVIVVVKCAAAKVAAILCDKRLVRKAHAGINIGNHHPRAVYSHRPNVVRVDVRQIGFDGLDTIIHDRGTFVGFIKDKGLSGADGLNFRETHQAVQRGLIGALNQDGVLNPVGLVFHLGILQISCHAGLGGLGCLRKGVVNVPPSLRPAHLIRRG